MLTLLVTVESFGSVRLSRSRTLKLLLFLAPPPLIVSFMSKFLCKQEYFKLKERTLHLGWGSSSTSPNTYVPLILDTSFSDGLCESGGPAKAAFSAFLLVLLSTQSGTHNSWVTIQDTPLHCCRPRLLYTLRPFHAVIITHSLLIDLEV